MKPNRIVQEEAATVTADYGREDSHLECEICGALGAERMGPRVVCDTCAEEMGSCCPEFGASDLWS
jgi:hypothetical protein